MANGISLSVSPFSWMRYSTIKQAKSLSGVDLLNPATTYWFGLFEEPDLSDRNGDLEYTLQETDRLDKLSQYYYGTPFLWWVIAAKNNLDLPDIQIVPGRKIIIPDPAYVQTTLVSKQVGVEA